jgi:cyclomaltodextrinase
MKKHILISVTALLAGLSSIPAIANDGRSPVVQIDRTDVWQEFSLARLGFSNNRLLIGSDPSEILVEQQRESLRIKVSEERPWRLLSTNQGDLLLKFQNGLKAGFNYKGQPGDTVHVFGSFNSWNRQSLPLEETAPGLFELTLNLQAGDYPYLLRVNGRDMRDPTCQDSLPNGFGDWNSLIKLEEPAFSPMRLGRLGWTLDGDTRHLRFLIEGADHPDWAGLYGNRALADNQVWITADTLHVRLPLSPPNGPDLLRIAVYEGSRSSDLQTVFFSKEFIWEDAIVYALMPDRFRNGNPANDDPVIHEELHMPANWQGGDLSGIQQAMDEGYFERLGVNVLWIYPLNESTDKAWREYPEPHRMYTGYHGYWPVHPTRIEPRFGTAEEFSKLVTRAHEKNTQVILDLVANHVHEEHPWVSQHPDWFGKLELPDGSLNLRSWDEHRLTTWFEPYMPDLDYANSPEAVEAMTDAAVEWIGRYGLDGFRHDAVKHVPRIFWERLTEKLSERFPEKDFYQIGETFGSDELISSYVGPDAMDAQFNFNLFHPAREIFLDPSRSFAELERILQQNLDFYGPNHRMGNLMDSHDKERYPSLAEGDTRLAGMNLAEVAWTDPPDNDDPLTYQKTRLYLSYLLTVPGIPFLYYGDEIAMAGATDPDNRRMMRFGKQLNELELEMLEATSNWVGIRRDRVELRRGDFLIVHADQETICWLRSAEKADGSVSRSLTALNKSNQSAELEIALPFGLGTHKLVVPALSGSWTALEEMP